MGGVIDAPLILQLFVGIVAAGAVYGGIRSDLRHVHAELMRLDRIAEKAHERLDAMGCGGRRYIDDHVAIQKIVGAGDCNGRG